MTTSGTVLRLQKYKLKKNIYDVKYLIYYFTVLLAINCHKIYIYIFNNAIIYNSHSECQADMSFDFFV